MSRIAVLGADMPGEHIRAILDEHAIHAYVCDITLDGWSADPLLHQADVLCISARDLAAFKGFPEIVPGIGLLICVDSGIDQIDALIEPISQNVEVRRLTCEMQSIIMERTWALILDGMRNVRLESGRFSDGRWECQLGHTLKHKTLGLLGGGGFRAEIVGVARAFEMQILVPQGQPRLLVSEGPDLIEVSMETLLRDADVISLHPICSAPSSPLIGGEELALVKPSVLVVSAESAAAVNLPALADAIRTGRARAAGLSVDRVAAPELAACFDGVETLTLCGPDYGSSAKLAQDVANEVRAWLEQTERNGKRLMAPRGQA